MPELKCGICGKRHATWEHNTYEKLRLAEIGVPAEHLFAKLPDEVSELINNQIRARRSKNENTEI